MKVYNNNDLTAVQFTTYGKYFVTCNFNLISRTRVGSVLIVLSEIFIFICLLNAIRICMNTRLISECRKYNIVLDTYKILYFTNFRHFRVFLSKMLSLMFYLYITIILITPSGEICLL